MENAILITGATGFLGQQLVKRFIHEKKPLVMVGRSKDKESFMHRVTKTMNQIELEFVNKNCHFIECSLFNPETVYSEIEKHKLKVDSVWHLAANLSFKRRDSGVVLKENIDSTKNFFEISQRLCVPFYFVSTAFMHGNRTGTLLEDELIKPKKFNNAYEESKFKAEEFLHSRASETQTVIFRPGILLSSTQSEGHFGFYVLMQALINLRLNLIRILGTYPHWIKKFFIKNNILHIPLPFLYSKDCYIDFVTVEWASEMMISVYKKTKTNFQTNYQRQRQAHQRVLG